MKTDNHILGLTYRNEDKVFKLNFLVPDQAIGIVSALINPNRVENNNHIMHIADRCGANLALFDENAVVIADKSGLIISADDYSKTGNGRKICTRHFDEGKLKQSHYFDPAYPNGFSVHYPNSLAQIIGVNFGTEKYGYEDSFAFHGLKKLIFKADSSAERFNDLEIMKAYRADNHFLCLEPEFRPFNKELHRQSDIEKWEATPAELEMRLIGHNVKRTQKYMYNKRMVSTEPGITFSNAPELVVA